MGKLTFILGGARSGKSSYALKLVKTKSGRVAFIATGQAKDKEMRQRIRSHKQRRPRHWQTFEEPRDIVGRLEKIGNKFDYIIIDCLTLWISNLILGGCGEDLIAGQVSKMTGQLKKIKAKAIIVSNEVGLGIVPQNQLARKFRDIAGRVNQIVAAEADAVYFMVSGLPWRMK